MWSWLETSTEKIPQPVENVQIEPVQPVNDTLVDNILNDLYSPEVLKAISEEKESEVKAEEEEVQEAEWEKDLDNKCNRQCSNIFNKKVKIVIKRNHLIILTVAYFANIFLFMFRSKCSK